MIWVSSISALDMETSPVNSRTFTPKSFNRSLKLPTTSATNAFIGATYTILNLVKSISQVSGSRCFPISWHMVSTATFVFPAPVGAQSNMFSGDNNAVSYTLDWTLFKLFMPLNAGLAHSGISSIGRSFSLSANGGAFIAGTCTSSYPFFCVRNEPSGSSHFALAIKRLP